MHDTQHDLPPTAASVAANVPRHGGPEHHRRSAHHTLLFGLTKNKRAKRVIWITAGVLLLLAAIVGVIFLVTDLSWERFSSGWGRMMGAIERLHPAAVLPLMAILPIGGFPIAVVYLVAGARFGPVVGGLVVAGVTAVHMLGTYLIGQSFLRAPLRRFIERRHKHLPEVPADEHAAVAVIATLVPGLPYFVRNYLLVLAGVRLSIFFTVCLPIYVARSYVTILLGNLSSDPSKLGLVVLLIFDVVKVGICAFVIWRLRKHHLKHHAHHHEPAHAADVVPGQPNVAAK